MSLKLSDRPDKNCVRCNTTFICKPEAIDECDCRKIELSFKETQFIAAVYNECVCNSCLLELKKEFHASQKPKAIFSWSGGKDSAYCLHKVLTENVFDVKYLLTTVNANFKRVSIHGVREELLDLQAASIGIPLWKVEVSEGTNAEYEKQMDAVLFKAKLEGIKYVIFGDIFLEDLRAYREANLANVNMKAVFPLWKQNTTHLINDFMSKRFKTITCCINDGYFNEAWVGKEIDNDFLKALPGNVDPCGENGEYHTFCYEGPVFKKSIPFTIGEKVYKPLEIKLSDDFVCSTNAVTKGFWFVDLIPF